MSKQPEISTFVYFDTAPLVQLYLYQAKLTEQAQHVFTSAEQVVVSQHTQTALRFRGAAEVIEKLASLLTPQQVLELRSSPELQKRIEALLEKNRTASLSEQEQQEWTSYEFTEHIVRLAKTHTLAKQKA